MFWKVYATSNKGRLDAPTAIDSHRDAAVNLVEQVERLQDAGVITPEVAFKAAKLVNHARSGQDLRLALPGVSFMMQGFGARPVGADGKLLDVRIEENGFERVNRHPTARALLIPVGQSQVEETRVADLNQISRLVRGRVEEAHYDVRVATFTVLNARVEGRLRNAKAIDYALARSELGRAGHLRQAQQDGFGIYGDALVVGNARKNGSDQKPRLRDVPQEVAQKFGVPDQPKPSMRARYRF